MKLRTPLLAAALVAIPALAACGGDDSSSSSTVTVPTGNTPVDSQSPDATGTPTGTGFDHATGPDDIVVRIGYEGGFIGPGIDFSRTPTLLVTGDGSVYTPGVTTLQFPGPLLLPTEKSTVTEEGVQTLLALAESKGLLAEPPEYPRNDLIADAADTVVEITVGGETYRHQAYALGIDGGAGGETDPARKALAEFVDTAGVTLGEHVATEGELLAGDLEIQAIAATAANYEDPTVTPWASDSGITLAGATCTVVPTSDATATALLTEATSTTLFTEGNATYMVAVRPHLPGGPAC